MANKINKKEKIEKSKKKEKIIVSACLLGEKCRYDGLVIKNSEINKLAEKFELIPVCPEVLGGLPVPRPPAEIESGDGHTVLEGNSRILDNLGNDVTVNFIKGAQTTLRIIQGHKVQRVILKSKSPSCGLNNIIRNGHKIKGSGVTAALLLQNRLSLEEFE